jgi:hypothetical protein
LYVGATNFFGDDHESEAGVETGELHILFDQAIHQINTNIRRAKVEKTSYGFRPVTITKRPIIGKTDIDNLSVATGTYRNGMVMAPIIAQTVVREALGMPVENPYPANGRKAPARADLDALLKTGAEDIVGILHEPGGYLPYDRSREIAVFIEKLLQIALTQSAKAEELRRDLRQRLIIQPINETMNRLYYEIMKTTPPPSARPRETSLEFDGARVRQALYHSNQEREIGQQKQ